MTTARSQSVQPGPQQALQPLLEAWAWQEHGACRNADLDLFFPPEGGPARERVRRERAAKQICNNCLVRTRCLAYALRAGEVFGIWGGTTPEERRSALPWPRA
jgi:WhiB family redox-sensing transcriptional regulator